uniref:Uncharacterized protein n=1 Tax=Setaria italica TaxID=4555 RepID=K3ZBL5_SETIT
MQQWFTAEMLTTQVDQALKTGTPGCLMIKSYETEMLTTQVDQALKTGTPGCLMIKSYETAKGF